MVWFIHMKLYGKAKSLIMFKMFQRSAFSGNKSEFWEENWSQGSVSQAISFYDINPDRDIFDRFLPQQSFLEQAGFNVIFSKKNGFLWGLRELSIIDSIMKLLGKSTKSEQVIASTEKNELVKEKKSSNGKGTVKSFIKRIIIKEDANICPPVAILQMLFSNMMFFIAIPKK